MTTQLQGSVMDMVREYGHHTTVISMRAVAMLDLDADQALAQLVTELRRNDVRVLFATPGSHERELMHKTGTLETIESHSIYPTVRDAVTAARPRNGSEGDGDDAR